MIQVLLGLDISGPRAGQHKGKCTFQTAKQKIASPPYIFFKIYNLKGQCHAKSFQTETVGV